MRLAASCRDYPTKAYAEAAAKLVANASAAERAVAVVAAAAAAAFDSADR